MPAVVRMNERNGPVPGTETTGVSNLNFGNIDSPNLDYTAYPIRRGENSFDKWIVLEWYTGSANKLSNFKFWRSDSQGGNGPSLPTGISVKARCGTVAGGNLTYAQPTKSTLSAAECPTSEGTALLPGPAQLTSAGRTFYVHAQLQTTSEAGTGDVGPLYFSWAYDEE